MFKVSCFLFFITCISTLAQNAKNNIHNNSPNGNCEIGAEIRPRSEYRDGFKAPRDKDSAATFLTTQRTRLHFGYTNQFINTKISVQDVRTWGEEQTKTDAPSFYLHEAWAELFLNKTLALKIGRQELKYDDQRLLAWSNWNQNAASHDLALLKFKQQYLDIHLAVAYNNQNSSIYNNVYEVDFYKTMQFLYVSYHTENYGKPSFLGILDGHLKNATSGVLFIRQTYGVNWDYLVNKHKFGLYGSYFYQTGQDKKGKNISAHFFHARVCYKITGKIMHTVGFDYFSGTDAADTSNSFNNTFSNLYGGGHRFLGTMNYFTDTEKDTKGAGIIDIYAKLNYRATKKLNAELACHNMSLSNIMAEPIEHKGSMQAVDRYLGTEIDFTVKYKLNSYARVSFGYSTMFASPTMEIIKGVSSRQYAQWAYIMFTIKPKILGNMKPE